MTIKKISPAKLKFSIPKLPFGLILSFSMMSWIPLLLGGLILVFASSSITSNPWFMNSYYILYKSGDFSMPVQHPLLFIRAMIEGISITLSFLICFLPFAFRSGLKDVIQELIICIWGYDSIFKSHSKRRINQDSYGSLYQIKLCGSEPLCLVEVQNATAEADGEFKKFLIRVPPHLTSAKEAVAWSFSMSAEDYRPGFQT